MRKHAEEFAEEDRKRKEAIEARNNADQAVYTAEKAVRDLGDKVPVDKKQEVEEHVIKVREIMDGEDTEKIRQETDALMQVVQGLGAAAYQQGAPETEAGDPTDDQPDPEGDEDVIEGDFKEM
jgi:molecular chaperone DnaK